LAGRARERSPRGLADSNEYKRTESSLCFALNHGRALSFGGGGPLLFPIF
jgi:hypothetical protein